MQLVKAHVSRFSRFLAVGGTTAAVYFVVFALLHEVLGAPYGIAVTFAYMAGVVFHFYANRNLTFRNSHGHLTSQLRKYVLVAAANYVVTIVIVAIVVEGFNVSPYWGAIAAVVTTTLAGYILFGHWVFQTGRDRAPRR